MSSNISGQGGGCPPTWVIHESFGAVVRPVSSRTTSVCSRYWRLMRTGSEWSQVDAPESRCRFRGGCTGQSVSGRSLSSGGAPPDELRTHRATTSRRLEKAADVVSSRAEAVLTCQHIGTRYSAGRIGERARRQQGDGRDRKDEGEDSQNPGSRHETHGTPSGSRAPGHAIGSGACSNCRRRP